MTKEQEVQKRREESAKIQAQQQQQAIVYIDTDGCEVTVLPAGYVFYNVADWW